MHAIPLIQSSSRSAGLSHPFAVLAMSFRAWKQRRRRQADLAMLMSMEPHMLKDIGVTLVDRHGASGMLQWHPAVLASTLTTDER